MHKIETGASSPLQKSQIIIVCVQYLQNSVLRMIMKFNCMLYNLQENIPN